MNDANKEELIRKFVDGELSAEEEAELMHAMAEDDSFRDLLRLDVLLKRELNDSFEVPADFTDSVMQKIEAKYEPELEKAGIGDKIANGLASLFRPRLVSLRPAYGMALAILLVALFFIVPSPQNGRTDQQISDANKTPAYITQTADEGNSVVWMRFVYADSKANSMAIAGDFNNWQPIKMHRTRENNQTIWTITIPLSHKEIHYMFLKNGKEWLSDPLAPQQQDDGFGHRNSVIPL